MCFVIGIAGGSGSGKSTFSALLKEELESEFKVKIMTADAYFKRPLPTMISPMTGAEMEEYNSPESVEYDRLYEDIHTHMEDTDIQVLIVEGNGILYYEKLRTLMDLKIFMDLEIEHRMYRRIVRNIANGRGSMEDIAEFYLQSARFSEQKFFIPTKRYADIVLNGDHYQTVGKAAVIAYVREQLRR